MTYEPMPNVYGNDMLQYLYARAMMVKIKRRYNPNFLKVTKPLYVFKKVYQYAGPNVKLKEAIANLIVPVGATIWHDHQNFHQTGCTSAARKMRATSAYVHSIALVRGDEVSAAVAGYDFKFIYHVGATVKPKHPFDTDDEPCTSGIHFFLNVRDALNY